MFCLPDIVDQVKVINYFCRISLVMYLVYYNYSNAGPKCQANSDPYTFNTDKFKNLSNRNVFKVVSDGNIDDGMQKQYEKYHHI